jgi:hypothetical protein
MWSVRRLWQALIVLAALACIANFLGPDERWLGVDLGATGAALFSLCVAGLIVLMALRPDQVFPETWSLAERRAWVGLAVTAMIVFTFGRFLWILSQLEWVPTRFSDLPVRHLINPIVLLGIAWGVAASVLGRGAGTVVHDERDLRLQYAADRVGDLVLCLAVGACVVLLANVSASDISWWVQPVVLANLLIEVLIAKVLVDHVALVTLYARARR